MSGYGQFCPVAQALEVIGERWTLLVIRELIAGSRRFNEIQRGVPLMSRSVLSQRLRSLCEGGIAECVDGNYLLTEAGRELEPIVMECGRWGRRWLRREIRSSDVDVGLLMWDMKRRIDTGVVPGKPILIEFEFRGAPRGKTRWWLHVKRDEVDLCISHPGHDVDLEVSTTPKTMAAVWLGEIDAPDAVRDGTLRLGGKRALVSSFPDWLKLSVFAGIEPARVRKSAASAKR